MEKRFKVFEDNLKNQRSRSNMQDGKTGVQGSRS